jgi:NAD+ kinase
MPKSSSLRNGRLDRVQLPKSRKPRFLILGDRSKPGSTELAKKLDQYLVGKAQVLGIDLKHSSKPVTVKPDVVLVLGGDGAMLAASNRLGKRQVPVMGINFGTVGFLAAVSRDRAADVLELVLNGKARCEPRALMHVKVMRDRKAVLDTHLLNEAVVSRAMGSSLVECDLLVDRRPVCTYRGDGVILSTPTGSTAYNLAAGGPILSPGLDAWVVTPIAPYMLGMRPLVLPGHRVATLRVHQHALFHADGHVEFGLKSGDTVRVGPSQRQLRLIVDENQRFFSRLRRKLHWGEGPNA